MNRLAAAFAMVAISILGWGLPKYPRAQVRIVPCTPITADRAPPAIAARLKTINPVKVIGCAWDSAHSPQFRALGKAVQADEGVCKIDSYILDPHGEQHTELWARTTATCPTVSFNGDYVRTSGLSYSEFKSLTDFTRKALTAKSLSDPLFKRLGKSQDQLNGILNSPKITEMVRTKTPFQIYRTYIVYIGENDLLCIRKIPWGDYELYRMGVRVY